MAECVFAAVKIVALLIQHQQSAYHGGEAWRVGAHHMSYMLYPSCPCDTATTDPRSMWSCRLLSRRATGEQSAFRVSHAIWLGIAISLWCLGAKISDRPYDQYPITSYRTNPHGLLWRDVAACLAVMAH